MSPQESSSGLQTSAQIASRRKPRADIYTVFLVIALLALLLGILFLYLELNVYEFKFSGAPAAMLTTARQAVSSVIGC